MEDGWVLREEADTGDGGGCTQNHDIFVL